MPWRCGDLGGLSDEEVCEVGAHDFVLLLLDFGVGVVWRED